MPPIKWQRSQFLKLDQNQTKTLDFYSVYGFATCKNQPDLCWASAEIDVKK
jgi:hypothetical protein